MKKWPIYSDFSILSHNSGNFGQNEKQVLFSEGATSGTEPSSFPESSMVMCKNVVYQYARHEHRPTIPLQAHCVQPVSCTVYCITCTSWPAAPPPSSSTSSASWRQAAARTPAPATLPRHTTLELAEVFTITEKATTWAFS